MQTLFSLLKCPNFTFQYTLFKSSAVKYSPLPSKYMISTINGNGYDTNLTISSLNFKSLRTSGLIFTTTKGNDQATVIYQ